MAEDLCAAGTGNLMCDIVGAQGYSGYVWGTRQSIQALLGVLLQLLIALRA